MTTISESGPRANEVADPASVLPDYGSRSPRVLMLTRYCRLGASSRLRLLQFKGPLERQGFVIEQHNLLTDDYLCRLYDNRPIKRVEIIGRYVNRIAALLRARSSDVIW